MRNKKAIYLLLFANSISALAQGITMIAIPWYFVNVFGLHSIFGVLYGAITGVSIFWVMFTGTLIDRFERKYIFMAVNFTGGLVFGTIAASGFYYGSVSVVLTGVAFATTFFIYNIHFPNLYAFAQQITEKKDYSRILSYLEVQHQTTSAVAGALGAVLLAGVTISYPQVSGISMPFRLHIEAWSLQQIFFLNACTYFIAFALIGFMKYTSIAERMIETGSMRKRFVTGLKYLKDHPTLFLFGSLSYSIFITILILNFFLMPTYVNNHLHAAISTYSIYEMFFAGGSILAGVFIARIFRYTRPTKAVIILSIAGAMFYFIGIINTHLGIFYFLAITLGLCNAGTRIMRSTYLFNNVPNDVIGRAGSIFHIFQIIFRLLFILLFSIPFFGMGNHIIYAFLILGGFIMLAAALLIINYKKIIHPKYEKLTEPATGKAKVNE